MMNGCEGIYHMQIAAYYIALLNVEASKVKDVKPGMSAAYYRKMWKQQGDDERSADKCWWLQLVDIAADEMLRPIVPVSGEAWSDERLAEHFAGIVAQQPQAAVAAPAPHPAPRPGPARRHRGTSSKWKPSTVWFGSTPIVLREDLAKPIYYTYCRHHSVLGLHCRKDIQINRPDPDTVVRKLRLGTVLRFWDLTHILR